MKFGSVCSGIEAASVAWNPLGWEAAWFSEIEPFPREVLKHHYPNVRNYGDMRDLPAMIWEGEVDAPDILCGGTPCQSFSVAGQRKSLDDDRGNLSLAFCEIANAIDAARFIYGEDPCIVFWENVPGVLSTKDNAFGCFMGGLVGSDVPLTTGTEGNKWPSAGFITGPKRKAAWRVLDAQYFGVPQRRKRVFVVASAREGFDPSKVLFERRCMPRDSESSREARKDVTGETENSFRESSFGQFVESNQAGTTKASGGVLGGGSETLHIESVIYENHAQDARFNEKTTCPTVVSRYGTGGNNVPLVLNDQGGSVMNIEDNISPTLRAQTHGHEPVIVQERVRKLTVVETERLQGFEDNYTRIPYKGKAPEDCPDSPRYKAIGNSWAVPCVRWIGERIKQEIEK